MESDTQTWTEKYAVSMNDFLETSIGQMGKILRDMLEEQVETAEDASDLVEVHNICYKLACKVTGWHERKYPTSLPWLPENTDLLKDMTLLSCKTPWSFVLTYPVPDPNLMKNISEESLRKYIETPKIGCFVCVVYRKKFFRGFLFGILSYNRLKVVNIDTSEVFIVPTTSLFHLPPEVCGTHALSMHCCMMEEDDVVEKLWSEELEAIFSRALQECSIKVENVRTVCQSPPKYMVELISTNKEGHSLNLTNWLHSTLIPDMKKSLPHLTAKEELLYFLKDESIDPFFAAVETPIIKKDVSLMLNVSKEKILSSLCAVPPPVEGLASSCASSLVRQSLKKNDDNKKENYLPSLPGLGKCPVYSGNKQCCDGSCLKNREFTGASIKCEDISIHGGPSLIPQVRNRIKLPGIGEQASVVITHVLPSLSFYVALEEKYSDFVAQGFTESYDSLINRLNDPFNAMNYTSLPTPPSVGQLVAFRTKVSALWVRGVITEVGCNSVNVLNPDLGQIERVLTNDLRTVTDEDTVLPFQAVLTFLHNIRFTECHTLDKAKDYFHKLIFSEKLHVVVKSVDIHNSAMEVELFTSDHVSINKALVAAGFCVKVAPSPPTTE